MSTKRKRISCIVCLIVIALLPSCKGTVDSPDKPVNADPSAVGFNVYMNRGLQTKAGWGGVLTLDDLKNGTTANGFGVFAYYGNGALYNETSKPDFMYDQQVTYNTTNNVWGYSPVKYWPNEFGEAASSEAADRLTFFAYAPFADVTPSTGVVTGDATSGIIGMSRNISAGDPVVMYSSSLTPGAGVDLCWGVAADAFTSSVDGDNNSVAAGYPFLNVIKPKTGDHLKFEFNHALAQLNVQIDADIDEVAADGKTKIYVRSVTFNGFSMRGSLNLNSNTTDGPIWYDISGTGKLKREPVTVYDGRTDGMEGVATASDVSEKPADMNPVIVQDKPYGDAGLKAGVTATAVNLFNNTDDNAPVMVIPTPGVPVSVTIVYDVETEDSRLAGLLSDGVTHGSSVENKITKNITTTQGNMILSAGKKYVVKLHLGLTSVKFDAEVANWDNTTYEGSGYLPENTTSLGTVTITDGSSSSAPISSLAMWMGETMTTAPTVAVVDEQSQPVTGFTTEWTSSNTGVATVAADGTVTPVSPGSATITVKVSKDGKIASKSYPLYINEVTGVSVSPATQDICINGTLPMKATLEINGGNALYGTVTTWPTVNWSSSYDKVTLDPASTAALDTGTAVEASTTAAAAANATTNAQATITATIGTISGTATLTCIDKISIASVDLGATSTTVWLAQGAATPSVTVMGTDSNPLTTGVTLAWASNNESVATVTDAGVITLQGTGTAKLTVTATLAESATTAASSKTADFMVYVNNVTGVTVAPASSNIVKDGTLDLTATLTINGGSDINGTVATWPTVTWTSNYDKVSLNPTSTDASNTGTAVEATTTASAAANATANAQATITAAVSTPFASSDVSGTSTLTCKDKISIDHIELGTASTTVWLQQGASTPTVTVVGTDGNPLTTGVTLAWTSNNSSVATVTDAGVITLQGTGTATLTVTATLAASATTAADTKTADFTVNVNAVTGITLTPATSNILIGSTLEVKATLTLNNGNAVNGTITAWPTVAWTSDYAKVTVISPSTAAQDGSDIVATTIATAANDATANTQATITATVDAAFTASSTSSVTQTCTLTCSNLTGSGNGFSEGWDEL